VIRRIVLALAISAAPLYAGQADERFYDNWIVKDHVVRPVCLLLDTAKHPSLSETPQLEFEVRDADDKGIPQSVTFTVGQTPSAW
jgi:hypothetical protein